MQLLRILIGKYEMTRKELADTLGISLRTLDNWENEKPELVRLINQGFALDESIEATEKHLENLKAIKANAGSGKFKLK
ncbi:MAG: transcriptional regulator with XRE-family HTH domain [Clostridium sp.]|jgi:transcriptional regulator with XRE-family HTH domain